MQSLQPLFREHFRNYKMIFTIQYIKKKVGYATLDFLKISPMHLIFSTKSCVSDQVSYSYLQTPHAFTYIQQLEITV